MKSLILSCVILNIKLPDSFWSINTHVLCEAKYNCSFILDKYCEPDIYSCWLSFKLNSNLLYLDCFNLTRPGVGGFNHSGINTIKDKANLLLLLEFSSKYCNLSASLSITCSVNGGLHWKKPFSFGSKLKNKSIRKLKLQHSILTKIMYQD